MAIDLTTKTNTSPVDSDYPYGNIKDDDGSGNGTPVDVDVYGDFHQFFARLFAKSGLTYNNLPDNDYTGFQYYEALIKVCKSYIGVINVFSNTVLTNLNVGKLINTQESVSDVLHTLPVSTTLNNGDKFTFYNNSNYKVTIQSDGSDAVMGVGDIELPSSSDFIELVLDKPNLNWVIGNIKSTPVKTAFDTIVPEATGDYTAPATIPTIGGTNTLQMRLNNQTNEVEFRGVVTKGSATGSPSIVIYNLPAGKRPAQNKLIPCSVITSGGATYTVLYNVLVSTLGVVACQVSSGDSIDLSGLRFSLD